MARSQLLIISSHCTVFVRPEVLVLEHHDTVSHGTDCYLPPSSAISQCPVLKQVEQDITGDVVWSDDMHIMGICLCSMSCAQRLSNLKLVMSHSLLCTFNPTQCRSFLWFFIYFFFFSIHMKGKVITLVMTQGVIVFEQAKRLIQCQLLRNEQNVGVSVRIEMAQRKPIKVAVHTIQTLMSTFGLLQNRTLKYCTLD